MKWKSNAIMWTSKWVSKLVSLYVIDINIDKRCLKKRESKLDNWATFYIRLFTRIECLVREKKKKKRKK